MASTTKYTDDAIKRLAEIYVCEACCNFRKAFKQFGEERKNFKNSQPNYRMLHNDTFKRYVRQYQQEYSELAIVRAEDITKRLAEFAFGDYTPNQSMKALDMLNRMAGNYTEHLELKADTTINVSLDDD